MIQRRQTLFLLQLIFFGFSLLFVPSIRVHYTDGVAPLYFLPMTESFAQSTIGHLAALALNILGLALSFVTIFLFKKRELQGKLCYALMLIWLGITLMVEFCPFIQLLDGGLSFENTHFGTLIGIFGMLAAYLALRHIRKDIALIKSADRIR